ncbi:MAG TPA: RDD family protein [Alphaproteobacteria bacterium]|nr:RDD family protein [Alphaproteobacteria bacterium]
MACQVCGKPYPCVHHTVRSAVLVDPDHFDDSEDRFARSLEAEDEREREQQRWRQEVVSRVQQHRAKRRKHSPGDDSLELDFPASNSAADGPQSEPALAAEPTFYRSELSKVIEFPSPSVQYFGDADKSANDDLELAEPIFETPRILDVHPPEPEAQLTLLSSFADIELEAEPEKAIDDLELPLRPASLGLRAVAGAVDTVLVLAATGVFGLIVFALAAVPQSRMAVLCGAVATGLLWLAYQMIFLMYRGTTPGMQAAQLELCAFDGALPSRARRGCRALAGLLCLYSLGLGFAWAFVDEDTLGWHDRITRTHLRQV